MAFDAVMVLQARMRSTRLPGKVVAPIGDASIVQHCLRRLVAANAGRVVLATTTEAEDDLLETIARQLRIQVVRGASEDVLGRFAAVARLLKPTFILRATADNPAVDIDSARRSLDALRHTGADYCCEHSLPYGTVVEAMKTRTLLDAHDQATAAFDREHVTPFIRRERARYTVIDPVAPVAVRRPDLRLTVDTPDDLAFLRAIAGHMDASLSTAPLVDVIAATDRVLAKELVA